MSGKTAKMLRKLAATVEFVRPGSYDKTVKALKKKFRRYHAEFSAQQRKAAGK